MCLKMKKSMNLKMIKTSLIEKRYNYLGNKNKCKKIEILQINRFKK
jgi:hypothetical protein